MSNGGWGKDVGPVCVGWVGWGVGVFGLNINIILSFKTQICDLRDKKLWRKKLFHVRKFLNNRSV